MNSAFHRFRVRPSTIAIVGAMLGSLLTPAGSALAQPASDTSGAPAMAGALTVTAPRVVRHEAAGGAGHFPGAPIEVLSVSRSVSFADLDLATRTGADEFRKRIMYGALAACDAIDAEYPSNIYVPVSAKSCPDTTASAALVVGDEIIAAARDRAR